jgi:hypothetical protein
MSNAFLRLVPVALLLLGLTACSSPEADPNIGEALARCTYINGFSDKPECKEYFGSEWTAEAIAADCDSPVPGSDPGLVEEGIACERDRVLGVCEVDPGTVEAANIVFIGDEGDSCNGLRIGCNFAGGSYVPSEACGGDYENAVPDESAPPFPAFEQVCMDPLPGQRSGDGPGGQVCTWEAISASTEEGRHYADYASCAPVWQQRPYWAAEARADTAPDDPRYSDPQWQREFAWVTGQVESSACVCCHSVDHSPAGGPSGWFLEADGLWIDTLDDDGLAMLAGWIDSTAFGAFDPSDNNGFERTETGLPTTDTTRMKRFLEGELSRRGFTAADFADDKPFGGPLADQLVFEPEACENGEGVGPMGVVRWTGGDARYVYVMAPWADNPGVPPNLDLPFGTLWRLDVAPEDEPLASGISYATAPGNSRQSWPVNAAAPSLVPGQTYYLYVLKDIYQPLTRCLFTAR